MLGLLVGAIAGGLVVWKYRDSLQEYVKGNAIPGRDKVDELLRTVQQTSETFLDKAKAQVSSGFERTRDRVRAGVAEVDRGRPTE